MARCVIPLTQPLQYRVGNVPILRALFEQFDIRGIMIHHCQWMYDNAWWVKKYFPERQDRGFAAHRGIHVPRRLPA